MKEHRAAALEALRTRETAYRFADLVAEFEKTVRIPQFFERVLSDDELAESLASLRAKADNVSSEKRALAYQVVHGIADALAKVSILALLNSTAVAQGSVQGSKMVRRASVFI